MFKLPLILISVSSLVLAACGSNAKTAVKESVIQKTPLVKKKKSSGGGEGGSSSSGSSTPAKSNNPYNNINNGDVKKGTYNLGVFGFDFTKNSRIIKETVNTYAKDKNAAVPGLGTAIVDASSYPGLVLQTSPEWDYAKDYNPAFRTNFKLFYDVLKAKLKIETSGVKNATYHSVGTQGAFDKVALFMYKNNDFTLEKKEHTVDTITIYDAITPIKKDIILDPTNGGSNPYVKYSNLAQTDKQLYAPTSDFWKAIGPLSKNVNAAGTKPIDVAFLDFRPIKIKNQLIYDNLVTNKIFKGHLVSIGENSNYVKNDVFSASNISSASYDFRISAFSSGFQSTIKAIKYDDKTKKFVKTKVGFFIGNSFFGGDTDCNNVNKGIIIMYINGIKAAMKHPDYKNLLDVKFFNKYPKGGETVACYKVNKWVDNDENKNLLYQGLKSKVMKDAEVRLVAILPVGVKTDFKNSLFSNSTIGGKKIIDNITEDFNIISSLESVETGRNEFDNKKVFSWGVDYNLDVSEHRSKIEKNNQNYIDNFMNGYFFGGPNYMVGTHTYYGNELEWLEEDGNQKIGYGLNTSNESKTKSKELMQKAYHDATVIDISKFIDLSNPKFTD